MESAIARHKRSDPTALLRHKPPCRGVEQAAVPAAWTSRLPQARRRLTSELLAARCRERAACVLAAAACLRTCLGRVSTGTRSSEGVSVREPRREARRENVGANIEGDEDGRDG